MASDVISGWNIKDAENDFEVTSSSNKTFCYGSADGRGAKNDDGIKGKYYHVSLNINKDI